MLDGINSKFCIKMTSIVKHRAAIALLVALLSNFSNCDYCPVSAPTVSVVSKCPTTKAEWDEAASRKKCSLMTAKCGNKSPVYHCLLNQWRNETVEVCASNWFISGFCAIYNTEEMKVIDDFNRDCTNLTGVPCPTRYISTDAYMYQGCYGKRNTSTPLPSTDKQVHVSTDCTLPASIIAIIIVFSLLSLGLFVLLVLTCQGLISKKVINQFIRSSKNTTTDEENGISEERLLQNVEREEDTILSDEDKIKETKPLLPSDQEAVTTPADKRDDGINTIPVQEKIKMFDPGNKKETRQKDENKWEKSRKNLLTSLDAKDTSTKDGNCRRVYEKERELMYNGRTDTLNENQTLEPKVEDARDNIKDIKTKDEDVIVESLGGKAISDGRTDLPNEDQTVERNFEDKDVIVDVPLPGNDLKVTDTQNMQSSDEEMEGTENRSKSHKEPENDEKNNAEESSSSSTEGDLSSNRENKTSTEKEEQSVAGETTNYVKKIVEQMQAKA